MRKEFVSIVIPTYNEEKVIRRNLKSLKNQSYKNIEIIVVDDGSTDKTIRIAKKYADKIYARKHAERSVQRNFGASEASGDFLVFLDADMKLTPKVIEECVDVMNNDNKVGGITISEISVAKTYWEKVKAFERSFYEESEYEATEAARFFRKSVFNKVGGYDERITGPEDWDLPERIKENGYKINRIKAKIYHFERIQNPFKVAKKKFYYGLKSYRYLEKHNVPVIGEKTIYFLRPVFYKNWKKLFANPILSLAMFFMLTLEQFAGGAGYITGKFKKY